MGDGERDRGVGLGVVHALRKKKLRVNKVHVFKTQIFMSVKVQFVHALKGKVIKRAFACACVFVFVLVRVRVREAIECWAS